MTPESAKRTQEALDASILDQIPTPEASELTADSAWAQWDAAVRMADLCEVHNVGVEPPYSVGSND